MRTAAPLFLALSLVTLAGCDPAKDKSKAVTTQAVTETTSATGVAYPFDQSTSKVEWTGAKVTAKHDGSFDTFKGTVNLVDNAPEKSSVTVDIDTASLKTTPEKLVGHLKSPDFFDVTKFPKATFASTKIEKGGDKGATHTVTGNLTLHGVTKGVTFPATVKVDGEGVGVNAEFAINRKDFGLVYPGMPDDLIREDVVIRLSIRAKKP